jgi:FkbM family methyltransferase
VNIFEMEYNRFYNNCDYNGNGEKYLYNLIKNKINVVFDVGCRDDSYYIDDKNIEYHLFDPNPRFIENLKTRLKNSPYNVKLNNFGLGLTETMLPYYEQAQSFLQRQHYLNLGQDLKASCFLPIKKLSTYCKENNVKFIDFLKIDTEGFEYDVIKGAETFLENIKTIQFEYGGTYPDRKIRLIDVVDLLNNFKIYLLTPEKLILLDNFEDHYQYCNYFAVRDTDSDIIL